MEAEQKEKEIDEQLITKLKEYIFLYISIDRANHLSRLIPNFETCIEGIYNLLKRNQFRKDCFIVRRGKKSKLVSLKDIYDELNINREEIKSTYINKFTDISLLESYFYLAGVLILKYIHGDIWEKRYNSSNELLEYYLEASEKEMLLRNRTLDSINDFMMFANLVRNIIEYIPTSGNKSKIMNIVGCFLEGKDHHLYVEGGSPSKSTETRLMIYTKETNQEVVKRPSRRKRPLESEEETKTEMKTELDDPLPMTMPIVRSVHPPSTSLASELYSNS